MHIQHTIPPELTALRQWVFWRYEDRGGKSTKVPVTAMGYHASVTHPEHWSEYSFLMEILRKRPGFAEGVGFVFSCNDAFCGIDLDNIWQSDADQGACWGWRILERFTDTYSEASPSSMGAKIWCRACAPRCGSWPIEKGAIEIYDRARFFVVTGRSSGIAAITDHQADVEALIANLDNNKVRQTRISVDGIIPYGTQHNMLVSLAGTMRRRGMAVEAIEAALLVVNRTQCERPGPDKNIVRIARSAEKWSQS